MELLEAKIRASLETANLERKWGDGTFLAMLVKLLAIFGPMFFAGDEEKLNKAIGDGTLITFINNFLNNPEAVANLQTLVLAIMAFFKKTKELQA